MHCVKGTWIKFRVIHKGFAQYMLLNGRMFLGVSARMFNI